MRFLLFILGSVTGRCLYLGSLNEDCKGWEGSRDNLHLGLLIKGQGIRNFVIWFITVRIAVTHTIFHGKSNAFLDSVERKVC